MILAFIFLICFSFGFKKEGLLVANIFLTICILAKSRFSLISVIVLITNYVLLNIYFFEITGTAYGILNSVKKLHFIPMLQIMVIFNATLFFWSSCTDFCEREKAVLNNSGETEKKNYIYICCGVAICATIIAFPEFSMSFDPNSRFSALLPGNAWNHLAIVALIAVVSELKTNKVVQITYFFVIIWFLIHFERVDVLGLLVLLAVLYGRNTEFSLKKIFVVSIVAAILFAVFTYLGEMRTGNSKFSFEMILSKIISQNTASDIGYTFHVTCDYVQKNELLYGKTYIQYILGIIPLIDTSGFSSAHIISEIYHTPGGEFFLVEPLLNFGITGVIVIPNIYILIIYLIIKKNNRYRRLLYYFLIATAFRYLWYGVSFIVTAIVWFIPFVYLLRRVRRQT